MNCADCDFMLHGICGSPDRCVMGWKQCKVCHRCGGDGKEIHLNAVIGDVDCKHCHGLGRVEVKE